MSKKKKKERDKDEEIWMEKGDRDASLHAAFVINGWPFFCTNTPSWPYCSSQAVKNIFVLYDFFETKNESKEREREKVARVRAISSSLFLDQSASLSEMQYARFSITIKRKTDLPWLYGLSILTIQPQKKQKR